MGNPAVLIYRRFVRSFVQPYPFVDLLSGTPWESTLLCAVLPAVPFVPPFSSFLSYSPYYFIHPLRPDVCIVVWPDRLIVVFVYSARPSALLPRCCRCYAGRWRKFRGIPGLLLREVDCYVTCDNTGGVGLLQRLEVVAVLVKQPPRSATGIGS